MSANAKNDGHEAISEAMPTGWFVDPDGLIGRTLRGRLRFDRVVHRGGQLVIFDCAELRLARRVLVTIAKLDSGKESETRRRISRLMGVRCDGIAQVLDAFEVKNVLVVLAAPPNGMAVTPGGRSEPEALALAGRVGKVLRGVFRRYGVTHGGSLLRGTAVAGESVVVHGFSPSAEVAGGQGQDCRRVAQLAYALVTGKEVECTLFEAGSSEFGARLRAVAESGSWDEALKFLDGEALPKSAKGAKRKKRPTFQRGQGRELSAREQIIQEAQERYKPKKWLIVLLYVLSSVIPIALYVLAHKGIIELPWMQR